MPITLLIKKGRSPATKADQAMLKEAELDVFLLKKFFCAKLGTGSVGVHGLGPQSRLNKLLEPFRGTKSTDTAKIEQIKQILVDFGKEVSAI